MEITKIKKHNFAHLHLAIKGLKHAHLLKKIMKSFANIMWLIYAATPPPLDPTTLRSAATSPLVLDIVVKTEKIQKGEER